jgi:hypothetical protein
MKYWEHGSEFDGFDYQPLEVPHVNPWKDPCYTSCGRDSLRLLLTFGKKQFGWNKLWIPSYYCQEVIDALSCLDINITTYKDSPLRQHTVLPSGLQKSDVVLLVNYFGIKTKKSLSYCNFGNASTIEDHTHDPWSDWASTSKASYCFASLRKTLPVPDGAVLWSPLNLLLPLEPQVTRERQQASDIKRKAMTLKHLFLQGSSVSKEEYRNLQLQGERLISLGDVSGITNTSRIAIDSFPIDKWRIDRLQNYMHLVSKIKNLDILKPKEDSCYPFSVVVLLDNKEQQDYVRSQLVSSNIYPAILWPSNKEKHNLSNRILSICCDMRYSLKDMDIVYEVIKSI